MFTVRRQLRANDFDTYGHLNQSVYHAILEDARVAYLHSLLLKNFRIVVARIELDYRREVPLGESEVDIGIAVARVGNSSFALDQRIWRLDGELAAEGPVVFAVWDPNTRHSRPLTDDERRVLEAEITT